MIRYNPQSIHPTPSELTRFVLATEVRDPRLDREAIRGHIASGCDLCRATVRRLLEAAHEEPFSYETATRWPDWIVPRRIALATAGVRGGPVAEEHLYCATGTHELDVIVEGGLRGSLAVSGRVLQQVHGGVPASDATVELIAAGTDAVVDSTRTDAFGEFDLFADEDGAYGIRLVDGAEATHVLVRDPAA